jgi:DNA-binding response OmpR family regulator
MYKILLIEDSIEIFQMMMLTVSSFADLSWSSTLQDGKKQISLKSFDLIVLDIELPDGNGLDFCNEIQMKHSQMPIFILTCHCELSEKVLGFSAGAYDYVTKPFSVLELRARIEACLKKIDHRKNQDESLKWREIQIFRNSQEVQVKTRGQFEKIELTLIEFKLLLYFATHTDVVINRDAILNAVWGEDVHIYHRSVDTHVSKLRRKLGEASLIIESIHGTGYKFSPTKM